MVQSTDFSAAFERLCIFVLFVDFASQDSILKALSLSLSHVYMCVCVIHFVSSCSGFHFPLSFSKVLFIYSCGICYVYFLIY